MLLDKTAALLERNPFALNAARKTVDQKAFEFYKVCAGER
jgi:hypothetical protein